MSMLNGVQIDSVADLYAEHDRFGRAFAPDQTSYNPLSGRCGVIPRKASHYAMVLEHEENKIDLASRLLKGLAGRRKVQRIICEKNQVNFNAFSRPGRVVVLYA